MAWLRYWDVEQCRFVVVPIPVEEWEVDAMTIEQKEQDG